MFSHLEEIVHTAQVIMWELATGKEPWSDKTPMQAGCPTAPLSFCWTQTLSRCAMPCWGVRNVHGCPSHLSYVLLDACVITELP